MDKEQRDLFRYRVSVASPSKLRAALNAMIDVAAAAELDFKDGDNQPQATWFADGVDTAVATAGAEMGLPFEWVKDRGLVAAP